jgi:hypothetical protein
MRFVLIFTHSPTQRWPPHLDVVVESAASVLVSLQQPERVLVAWRQGAGDRKKGRLGRERVPKNIRRWRPPPRPPAHPHPLLLNWHCPRITDPDAHTSPLPHHVHKGAAAEPTASKQPPVHAPKSSNCSRTVGPKRAMAAVMNSSTSASYLTHKRTTRAHSALNHPHRPTCTCSSCMCTRLRF